MNQNQTMRSPFRVYCRNCGAPAGFDILQQSYRCVNCGQTSGIPEAKQGTAQWRSFLRQQAAELSVGNASAQPEEYSCPACGAQVLFAPGEAAENCGFCGSKLVRRAFAASEAAQPELIIPFYITYEEARARMLAWGHEHEKTPEGRSVVSSMGQFQGVYLPYQLVRGPIYATVSRDGTFRDYLAAGYVEGAAVCTAGGVDNLVLDEVEPFDWSGARPFNYGYLAGSRMRMSDLTPQQAESRVAYEAAESFKPDLEKALQSADVDVSPEAGALDAIPVLLPIYYIRSGKLTAVMNGQTGKIAVTKEREKKSYPYLIEPGVYTVLATLISSAFLNFDLQALFYFGLFFGILFFAIFTDRRSSLVQRVVMRTKNAKATREGQELKISEDRDILKNPYGTTPVFYERLRPGAPASPVKIRFYTFERILEIFLRSFFIVFLPVFIAAPLRLLTMGPGEKFMDKFVIGYGAAWYVIAGFLVFLYLTKGVRRDIYEKPIFYEILPDGSTRLATRFKDRRLSILGLFTAVGTPVGGAKGEEKMSFKEFLNYVGLKGVLLLFGLPLLFMIGCVAAMIT